MNTRSLVALIIVLFISFSCKRNKPTPIPPPYGYWSYNGVGDGNVEQNQNVVITVPIQSNLNVDGKATLGTNTTINNDLNLNHHGKVVVATREYNDTIFVYGNVNVNDSLLVEKGILKVSGDFNINSRGVVNCSNEAEIIISGHLNQAGTLYGNANVQASVKNLNNPGQTYEQPLP